MPHAPSLVQSPSGQPFPLVRIKPSGCVVRQRVLLPDRILGRAYGPTRASRRAGSERVQHPPTSSLSGASAKPFLLRCPASRSGRPSSRRSRWAIRRSSRQPRSGVPDAFRARWSSWRICPGRGAARSCGASRGRPGSALTRATSRGWRTQARSSPSPKPARPAMATRRGRRDPLRRTTRRPVSRGATPLETGLGREGLPQLLEKGQSAADQGVGGTHAEG